MDATLFFFLVRAVDLRVLALCGSLLSCATLVSWLVGYPAEEMSGDLGEASSGSVDVCLTLPPVEDGEGEAIKRLALGMRSFTIIYLDFVSVLT